MAEKILGTDRLRDAYPKINGAMDEVNNFQTQINQIVVEGDSSVEAAQARVDADGTAYTTLKERLDTEHGEVTSQLVENANEITQIKADKKQTPIQQYGHNQIFIDFPPEDVNGYSVAADIAFADDREGATGKLWAFYSDSYLGRVRREVPYVGCDASELGTPVVLNNLYGGHSNHFVFIDGYWYVGAGTNVFRFTNGIDQEPELLSTVSSVGQNGDQSFTYNLCVNKDASTGVWHGWYSTFDGTAVGIRHATSSSPSGPWTIEPGFWLTAPEINAELNWLRVYKVIQDKWGRLWAVAGAGRKWGGTGWPDKDDGASVWMTPVANITSKPSVWDCVVDLPYFDALPYGSPLINNAYAPSFLQDGDDWYLYVNSGEYGHERILELKPNLSQSWTNQNAAAGDYYVGSILWNIESSRAFVRDGNYKITLTGNMLNNHTTAQWHSVFFRMKDAETGEIFGENLLQIGDHEWESRQFHISTIVKGGKGRVILVETMYSVGAGQVEPVSQTSILRGVSLSIERLS